MKVLLYFEGHKWLAKSGIGRALKHQTAALNLANIEITTNPKDVNYDVLHINTYGPNSINVVKKAKKMGKPVIYHAHSTQEDFRNSFPGSNKLAPLYKDWLTFLYKQADVLITPTEYSKGLLENYGLKQPIKVVSNGINLQRYAKNEEKIKKFKKRFDIKDNEKVIISVGLFFDRKGICDFADLAKKYPEYRFIWFGSTPWIYVKPEIKKMIQKNHPSNIEFPGFVSGDVIEGAYCGADAFVFMSYEETEGIVVLESLASEQKTLVRDIPVYDGWLEDGVNCFKAKNNAAFADILPDIVENDYQQIRREGLLTAQSRSIEHLSQQLVDIYKEVLKEK